MGGGSVVVALVGKKGERVRGGRRSGQIQGYFNGPARRNNSGGGVFRQSLIGGFREGLSGGDLGRQVATARNGEGSDLVVRLAEWPGLTAEYGSQAENNHHNDRGYAETARRGQQLFSLSLFLPLFAGGLFVCL